MSVAPSTDNAKETARYRVTGMDCASCAAKIEKAVRLAGVENVEISTATQIMTLHVNDPPARLPEVERAVSGIGYQLDRLDGPNTQAEGWPDLFVAAVIAGLFLQSSWVIVRDARADLRETA